MVKTCRLCSKQAKGNYEVYKVFSKSGNVQGVSNTCKSCDSLRKYVKNIVGPYCSLSEKPLDTSCRCCKKPLDKTKVVRTSLTTQICKECNVVASLMINDLKDVEDLQEDKYNAMLEQYYTFLLGSAPTDAENKPIDILSFPIKIISHNYIYVAFIKERSGYNKMKGNT